MSIMWESYFTIFQSGILNSQWCTLADDFFMFFFFERYIKGNSCKTYIDRVAENVCARFLFIAKYNFKSF